MELFVCDMLQDVFLRHLHYHHYDELMAHQLTKKHREICKMTFP